MQNSFLSLPNSSTLNKIVKTKAICGSAYVIFENINSTSLVSFDVAICDDDEATEKVLTST